MPRARKVTKEAEADVMAFAAEAGEQTIADQASKIPPTLWKPGVSGNPRGRPPEPEGDLVEVLLWKLGKSGPRMLAETLIGIANNELWEDSESVSQDDEGNPTRSRQRTRTYVSVKDRLAAATYIYDRIVGRPRQAVAIKNEGDDPIVTLLRQITSDARALNGRDVPMISGGDPTAK